MQVLAERQRARARDDLTVLEPRMIAEIRDIAVPGMDGSVNRFHAKTAGARRLCRALRVWLKTDNALLTLWGLTRQERWYAHNWCECWVGLYHASTGSDPD